MIRNFRKFPRTSRNSFLNKSATKIDYSFVNVKQMKKMDNLKKKRKTFVFCISSENSWERIFNIFEIIVFFDNLPCINLNLN